MHPPEPLPHVITIVGWPQGRQGGESLKQHWNHVSQHTIITQYGSMWKHYYKAVLRTIDMSVLSANIPNMSYQHTSDHMTSDHIISDQTTSDQLMTNVAWSTKSRKVVPNAFDVSGKPPGLLEVPHPRETIHIVFQASNFHMYGEFLGCVLDMLTHNCVISEQYHTPICIIQVHLA